MKTCGACSREIPDIAKFYPYCGVPVKAAASNFKVPVVNERPREFSKNTMHLRIAVYADNELAGVLNNGDRTRLSLPLGVHRIGFDSKAYGSFAEYA